MSISSVLSNAIFGLTQSAGRAGKAVEKVVTADVQKQVNGDRALHTENTLIHTDPVLARMEGLIDLNIEKRSFAANAAVIRAAARAEKELGRLLDITA